MPEIKQRTQVPAQKEHTKKIKINQSRIAAIVVIIVCLITTSVILINTFSVKSSDSVHANLAHENNVHNDKKTFETPLPTPTPKPTPSALNPSKLNETYPADITRALIVNGAESADKVAYLTFDDGPSSNTTRILETLNTYNAKATFFVTGSAACKNPELVKRLYDEGHTIGNHSYSHDYKYIYGSEEQFLEEIDKNEKLIGSIIGSENVMKLFRFPGGSFGEKRAPFKNIISKTDYKYVDWNALNSDADGKPFSAERCMSEIKKYCTNTGDVVILMHDTAAKDITADMLPQVMEYLVSQGYKFERIVP